MMSSGPSIKIFSDYLSKIYNLPHESTFPNSTTDGQDPQRHSSDSSVKPTDQMQNEQRQYGSSHAQKGRQDAILKTAPAVFDSDGAKTSFKFPEQLKEPIKDSHEIPARSTTFEKSQLDEPGELKMKQPEEGGSTNDKHSQYDGVTTGPKSCQQTDGVTDSKRRQSDSKRNHRDKVSVGKDKYPNEPKGSKDNPDDKPSTDANKFSGPTKEKSGNEVEVKQPNRERGVRHVPTVVEHVLQNKMDVLSPISSRRSLSEKGSKMQECSSKTSSFLTILDDSSCSFKEELLSSSYDQGPVRTFGRGELDGPLSQSTLKSALEPGKLFTGSQEVKTDGGTEASDEESEIWTTAISGESVTEIWTGDVGSPNDAKDDILKQSTTKNVGEMQRILQRDHIFDSPRKDPVLLFALEDETAADNRSLEDNVAPTGSVSNIRKAAKIPQPSSLVLIELKGESLQQLSNPDSMKSKLLPTSDKKVDCQSSHKEDDGKSDLKGSPLNLKLEEIKCKSCESVLSTREALKMHTCHSILDKLIQSDGGTRRRIFSSDESKAEASPSVKPAPKSATVKAKTKKKVNSIIAIKDDKLAKGELLYDYAQSRKQIEEKIEADRVDENQTKLVSPRLKKSSNVFNLNPLVLHKIKDKSKYDASISSLNSSTPILTKNSKNDSPAKLLLERVNSSQVQIITETVNSSEDEVTTETDKVSKSFKTKTKDPVEAIDTIRAIRHIAKTKAKQKVDLPKQSLSQLKLKAQCQGFTFKIRHFGEMEKTDEKGRENSGEMAHLRGQDNSSQNVDPSSSNVLHQSTHEYGVKHSDEKSKDIHQNKQEDRGKHSGDKSEGIQQVKIELKEKHSDEKAKIKHQIKQEFKEKYFDVNTKSKLENREKYSDVKLVKPEKTGEDYDSKKNSRRKWGGNSKDTNIIEHEHSKKHSDEKSRGVQRVKPELQEKHFDEKSEDKHQIKHENKEKLFDHIDKKYSDVKMVKLEKTDEDCDRSKTDNLVKLYKKVKEEVKSEGQKCPSGNDKVIGNVREEEIKLEVLPRKDSIKKESMDMPKSINIVNHFEPYNPPIVIQDSPPRKRHKSDKTPNSHKESYERKVKSDEKHSRKRKHNSSPCKSESSPLKFKIPKMEVSSSVNFNKSKNEAGKPPKKVKGFATTGFLHRENIKTLPVGDSGLSFLESLLSDNQKTDIQGNAPKAMEMFDKIDSKQNKMANNKRYAANDPNERSNIINEGWNELKSVKGDKNRKEKSENMFGNSVSNHPNNNLTYHGYKRYKSRWQTDSYPRPDPSSDFWDKRSPMFHLTDGEPKPLPHYRFQQPPIQQPPSIDEDQLSCEASDKKIKLGNEKIKLEDFVTFMKTIMYNKKAKKENMDDDKKDKNESKGDGRKAMEEFKIFLGHYKAGLEETTNFLEFYQNQGQVELLGWQVIQIMELENQFSTFSGYYGPTDELYCVACKKKHTFAL